MRWWKWFRWWFHPRPTAPPPMVGDELAAWQAARDRKPDSDDPRPTGHP